MNKKTTVPAPSKLILLRQICNFIPEFLVAQLARETRVAEKTRTFNKGVPAIVENDSSFKQFAAACVRFNCEAKFLEK